MLYKKCCSLQIAGGGFWAVLCRFSLLIHVSNLYIYFGADLIIFKNEWIFHCHIADVYYFMACKFLVSQFVKILIELYAQNVMQHFKNSRSSVSSSVLKSDNVFLYDRKF